ncbi:uncharacterized protein LOC121976898 isoform X1 [Zingiber officinale]|uniref:uncharacterized protein LOC121976898 isoform X1 n=1 Tax=Zingiber officinale TaxID=94328 RepID=UPI001C4ABE0B|nr:uncharacterized protein LOC121976898 isoform X1 [Zingiber officinale]
MPTAAGSPSSSSTDASLFIATSDTDENIIAGGSGGASGAGAGRAQSWWECISKARSRILDLASLLSSPDLASIADSDRPARSLLESQAAAAAIASALSSPSSGSDDDPFCNWLYDTLQSSDPELHLVALSFVPLISGLYLSRVVATGAANSPSLSGFEAVLLALYAAEVKARSGRPVLVSVPDLSLPSLYHSPGPTARQRQLPPAAWPPPKPSVGVLSPPLEPQIAAKSTKRTSIVAVALDSYYKSISSMPSRSKIDLCEFVSAWAGQDCSCRFELDDDDPSPSSAQSCLSTSFSSSPRARISAEVNEGIEGTSDAMRSLALCQSPNGNHCNSEEEWSRFTRKGSRVPLPWELLQPILRILGHCLLTPSNPQEVRHSASMAVRCVYARASHDLLPQAILCSRCLIQLDNSTRKSTKTVSGSLSKETIHHGYAII